MLHRSAVPAVLAALVLALSAVPAPAQEMSRDQVLENYYEAVGGLDAWDDVETMKAMGQITLGQGMTAPFTVYSKRPDRVRVEFDVQGMTGVQAFDGETAWMVMPFTGSTEPQEMPAAQAEDLKRQADFDGPLMGWQEEGHQIEMAGRESVDGTPAYRLDVTLKDGDVQHYFLDAEAFVPIKITGSRMVQGSEVEFYTDLGDYKSVDGLMMAHSIESGMVDGAGGQTITIDSVELGTPIPDSLFSMPESGEEETGSGGR